MPASQDKSEPLLEAPSAGSADVIVPPHLRNMVDTSPGPSPAPSNLESMQSGENDTIMTGPALAPVVPPLEDKENIEKVPADEPSVGDSASKEESSAGSEVLKTGSSPVLRLPSAVRKLWNDFRNAGEEPKPDADGFVLIDRSNFAAPEKVKPKLDRPRTALQLLLQKLPPAIRNISMSTAAVIMVILFFLVLTGTPLMQAAIDGGDNIFINWNVDYNVAFVGNSYMYVNDVPRLMEAVSEGHISQSSCINAAGSLGKLLRAGNGMNERWRSEEAVLRTGLNNYYDFIDEDYVFYDFGACTVYQLLEGYDNDLVYQNYNGAYYDDGTNPCFQDDYYLGLLADRMSSKRMYWDFVVLNDQTKRMAFQEAREETIDALKYAYAPMIRDARAIPIIVDTHAFQSAQGNMTGLGDVAYFTAEIYEGLKEYVLALKYNLPERLTPRVAPIGLAYLTVYEENANLWDRLFLSDQVHSSPAGSYLFANVLYCTIYGHLPHSASHLGGVEYLFESARDVQDALGYPTNREANYLRSVAKKVALHGYIPRSLRIYSETQFNVQNAEVDEEEMEYYWNGYDNSIVWDEEQAEEDRYQQDWYYDNDESGSQSQDEDMN